MIEQHLSLSDGVVNRMIIYTVAYHHWPEQLIMKNKEEKRGISKLIYREEALHYGIQFVESSELSNDDVSSFILNNESNRMYIQSPSVSEMDVSNLIASFYSTPTKRTVDCDVPFPFFVDEPPNPIPLPMVPSKMTAKPAIDCGVPFFPSDFFNLSPSIQLPPTKLITSTSNDPPPSNDINPPAASDFFHVDASNESPNTNPELSTRPTPIDCCVFIPLNPNPLPLNPTIDCCVPITITNAMPTTMPDSPDAVLSVEKIHEYIKGKVKQNGIAQELLTSKFYTYIKLLQRIHMNFDPIVCQFGIELKNAYVYPCPNVQQRNHDTCQLVTIRLILKKKGKENDVYCQTCARLARNRLVDVEKRRTAPDSRVPISYLSIDELHEKMGRQQHTNREAKGAITSSFRGELKVLTKGSHNNKVKRRKMK
jgi:hypothetical protein